MALTVDTRGLACPEPVIKAKKALENHDSIEVLADNITALENIRRMAANSGCIELYEELPDGSYRVSIEKNPCASAAGNPENNTSVSGPTVAVLSSDIMGRGDDELGRALMKAFIHTLTELETAPDTVILYNTGVKLAQDGGQSADDLKSLIAKGAAVLVCGTCANHFDIKDKIAAGTISNMYDIAGTLMKAGRIVCP